MKFHCAVIVIFILLLMGYAPMDKCAVVTACSQVDNYSVDATNLIVKRTTQLTQYETFIMLDNFSVDLKVAGSSAFDVKLQDIQDEGGIMIGICLYDPGYCLPKNMVDIASLVLFSGVSIAYFGDNCYHIDSYVNTVYWITLKHCLSKYELYEMTFKFDYAVPNPSSGTSRLVVNFDDFEYYNRNNIRLDKKAMAACTSMFSTSQIKFLPRS